MSYSGAYTLKQPSMSMRSLQKSDAERRGGIAAVVNFSVRLLQKISLNRYLKLTYHKGRYDSSIVDENFCPIRPLSSARWPIERAAKVKEDLKCFRPTARN